MSDEVYKNPDIHKSAAIIIRDRKLLVSRSKGKDFFIAPGGKLEEAETSTEACVRELQEEQGITIDESALTFFDTYYDIAAGHEDEQLTLRMDVYVADIGYAEPSPQTEIEENRWITSADVSGMKLGSIFAHNVIPLLIERDLID